MPAIYRWMEFCIAKILPISQRFSSCSNVRRIQYILDIQHRLYLRVSNLSQPYINTKEIIMMYLRVNAHINSLYVRHSRLKSRYIGGVYRFRMLPCSREYICIYPWFTLLLSQSIIPNRTNIIPILTHSKLKTENTTFVTEPYVSTSWSSFHCDRTWI